jgi:predicted glycosyltransferase
LIVFGPFMQPDIQTEFLRRVAKLPNVHAITFDPGIETHIDRVVGVVAMGGYNTFCEILSFDKPAIIVPRTMPRREQLIRAERAQELGLVKCLVDNGERTAQEMAPALRHLPQQGRPSDKVIPGLLDGLTNVNRLMERKLKERPGPPVALAGRQG